MINLSEIRNKRILLDTNILVNCGRDEFGSDFRKILRKLRDNENAFAISAISGFEIIKKFGKDEKLIKYYFKLLNFLPYIELNPDILSIAARMANKFCKNIDTEYKHDFDIIISATVFHEKDSLLLTCDKSGYFKEPFWNKIARECVYWEDNEVKKVENVFLLELEREKLHIIKK